MGHRVELLAPAGSFEILKAAVKAGADAVYAGGTRFGARAFAENFDKSELLEAIDYMHLHGKRLYLTVNTLLRDDEAEELYDYLTPYYLRGLDAVIVQDIGVMKLLRRFFPELPVHVSTQSTVTSVSGADYFKKLGAVRIVPARELQLKEIRGIKQETGLEIECFIHGALCYCYSGQCLLSSMIGGRSGNRGQCAQPCRLTYQVETSRFDAYQSGNKKRRDSIKTGGKHDLMSLKDLDTIELLPDLIEAGIDSFKIEGRMKQIDYVYTVVSFYRKYIDMYLEGGRKGYHVSREDKTALERIYKRRGYGTGYYFRHNGKEMISLKRPETEKVSAVQIPDIKIQEKIKGSFRVSKEKPAILEVSGNGCRVSVKGPAAQNAEKRPLSKERIEAQLRKTGNTPFCFEALELKVENGIFLPVQAISEMRREALARLEQSILGRYGRKTDGEFHEPYKKIEEKAFGDTEKTVVLRERPEEEKTEAVFFAVLARTREQLDEAVQNRYVSRIYIEASFVFSFLEKSPPEKKQQGLDAGCLQGKELFLASPYIFRQEAERDFEEYLPWIEGVFQGILVRNIDVFSWLKSHGYRGVIHTDSNVYVWNQWSKAVLRDSGVDLFYAPVELNSRELERLNIAGQGLSVYGYQPVMVSANCILKTTSGCVGKESCFSVKDRYGKRFPVWNLCRYCYNVIFNCEPSCLADEVQRIRELSPSALRLDFLHETKVQMRNILEWYAGNFAEKPPEGKVSLGFLKSGYTRGHFRRGVK